MQQLSLTQRAWTTSTPNPGLVDTLLGVQHVISEHRWITVIDVNMELSIGPVVSKRTDWVIVMLLVNTQPDHISVESPFAVTWVV